MSLEYATLFSASAALAVLLFLAVTLPVYLVGILRAWELVGAERYGFLARLSPLRDLDQV